MPGAERHFVVGADKLGVLSLGWNLRAVTKEQTVRFRRAVHLETDYLVRMCPKPDAPEGEDPARHAVVTGAILGEDELVHAQSRTLMVVPR